MSLRKLIEESHGIVNHTALTPSHLNLTLVISISPILFLETALGNWSLPSPHSPTSVIFLDFIPFLPTVQVNNLELSNGRD